MKKILALILSALLLCSTFASCGGTKGAVTADTSAQTETAEQSTADDASSEEAAPAEEEAAVEVTESFDASKLTDYAWSFANANGVGALTFSGNTAELNLFSAGADNSITGDCTIGDGTLNISGTDMTWTVVASFCKLTLGDTTYTFSKASDAGTAKGPYTLLTNNWSGDGMSLNFDGTTAEIKIDGGIDYTGTYSLTSAATMSIPDEKSEASTDNLALEYASITSQSVESTSYPPEDACDGNTGTRFASEYADPEWWMIDLGSVKKVGGAIIYFEAAYSTEFYFEVSTDGENWTEVAHVYDNAINGTDVPCEVPFSDTYDAQYVRYTGVSRGTSYGHSFWELELYEYIPGVADINLAYSASDVTVTYAGTSYKLTK